MAQDERKARIVVICGPTGIGKTDLAVRTADFFGGEIVGADSMQVYRHMDIGTAKPTAEERARVPHHLVDVADPDAPFDAKKYAVLARKAVDRIHSRGSLPLVVGGTGLYIKALLHGLFRMPAVDPGIRERLRAEVESGGPERLYARLRRSDPEGAGRIHPHDTYRILRSLEVLEATGKPISAFHRGHRFRESPFNYLKIGLYRDREALYKRIGERVEGMIEAGLREEVQGLMAMGYAPDLKSMQSLGYRHMVAYLAGRATWDETVETLKRDTRRFAKRQMTWFKADPDVLWVNPDQSDPVGAAIASFLSR